MSLVSDQPAEAPGADGRAIAVASALRRAARQSRAPVGFVSGGGGFRARKGDRLYRRGMIAGFVLIAALPTLCASAYYGLIASDQYATEARFSLRGGEASALDSLSGLAGLAGSRQNQDSQVIVNFIPSRGMVEKLDLALDLRRIFSRPDIDWLSRFPAEKPIEDLEKYWGRQVDVSIDTRSSIILARARAFTPKDSYDLAVKIEAFSEQMVNDLTARAREDGLRNAKDELVRAEAALAEATQAMRDARNEAGVIDADATAAAAEKIVGELRLRLASLSQQAEVTARSLGPDTPQMRNLNRQIEGMKDQIARMRAQIAGPDAAAGGTLADSMGALSQRQMELDIAQRQYAAAAVQYESARVDVETRQAYLVEVAAPTPPQKALYPKRLWGWALIVLPALLLWSILAGLASMARDHMAV